MMRILFYDNCWGSPPDLDLQIPGFEIVSDRACYDAADVVVFHIPEWKADRIKTHRPWSCELFPKKRDGQLWVAHSMECESHYPMLRDVRFMKHFDLTMTYRLDADIPLTYAQPFGTAASAIDTLRRSPSPKHQRALLAAFVSSGADASHRRAYLHELSQYMAIDFYGKYLNNRTIENDQGRASKLATIAGYKFTAAFENARAKDYVTEKFFDPLLAGSVPVYFGAPNVDRFAPGDRCYIDATDFPDPKDLAAHLSWLDGHTDAYQRYFLWKQQPLREAFVQLLQREEQSLVERLCDRLKERSR